MRGLARSVVKLKIAAVIASGAIQISGPALKQAFHHINVTPNADHTLRVIAGYQDNPNAPPPFPSFETLAGGCKVGRRRAIERVRGLEELTLEANGVMVIVERRWKAAERGRDERARSNIYHLFLRPDVAARAGWRDLKTIAADGGADRFAAPPPPTVIPPGALPSRIDGAAAGTGPRSSPPPTKAPQRPLLNNRGTSAESETKSTSAPSSIGTDAIRPADETAEEAAIREALLAHPETRDLAEVVNGFDSVRKLWAIALNPGKGRKGEALAPRTVAQVVAAIEQLAKKTLPSVRRGDRWSRLVGFVMAADPQKAPKPRLAEAAKPYRSEVDPADYVDARTAAALGFFRSTEGAPQRARSRDDIRNQEARELDEKRREQLARLEQFDKEEAKKRGPP